MNLVDTTYVQVLLKEFECPYEFDFISCEIYFINVLFTDTLYTKIVLAFVIWW